eukprot:144230-Amphidinium_carterae.2
MVLRGSALSPNAVCVSPMGCVEALEDGMNFAMRCASLFSLQYAVSYCGVVHTLVTCSVCVQGQKLIRGASGEEVGEKRRKFSRLLTAAIPGA